MEHCRLNPTFNWRKYLGLPHEFGADPEDGVAADCVLMTWNVLDAAGVYRPPLCWEWFTMAKEGKVEELMQVYDSLTYTIDGPEEYAVTLTENGETGVGLAVVVDGGLLIAHHRKGVRWLPIRLLKKLQYRRFRNDNAAV